MALAVLAGAPAHAVTINLSDPSGLAAEIEFTLIDPTTLEVRLRNTSTGVPLGFSNSDQILTGVSWDFPPPGLGGSTAITGGSVVTGPSSSSVNFSVLNVGPNTSVDGEWGYGNLNGTGALPNFITANAAVATPFGGPNLDGPASIDGPQGGLVASPALVPLGGLGAIQDEVIATLTLSDPIADLSFLNSGVRVEFGSDAAFITGIPEPSTVTLLLLGGTILAARRPRRR